MNDRINPVWVEVNLTHVEQNVRAMVNLTGVALMAVVKANAYGYGAVEVARAAMGGGATWLGVARVDEALILREAGFEQPMLVLGMVPYAQVDQSIAAEIHLPIACIESADVFSNRAQALGKKLKVHLKFDTGMGRLGVLPAKVLELAQHIRLLPGLQFEGLYSHLANADHLDDPSVLEQNLRFEGVVSTLQQNGIRPKWIHLANTAGALAYPDSRYNLVRAGQGLIGHNAFSDRPLHPAIQPAMHAWKARLVSCYQHNERIQKIGGRDKPPINVEVIGVVSAGFCDGIWRLPGNEVLIDGKRFPVIGLPDEDHMLIALDREYPGDTEVMLVGSQGEQTITIQDLARRYETGPGKITSVIPERVKRVYSALYQ